MKTVRRLYLYGIAIVSLEVVIWGVIGLLRGLFAQTLSAPEALLRALALVLVGVPIFLFHWLWGKRLAKEDAEEATSLLRAIFFYAVLFANGIPIFQNLLAILNRALIQLVALPPYQVLFGGGQRWSDNLIAIFVLSLFWGYFWKELRQAWQALSNLENFLDARRLYRFLWMLYGLVLLMAGAIQLLRSLFYQPLLLGGDNRPQILYSLTLLILGAPLWYYAWTKCQENMHEAEERESLLRLGSYALLHLGSALVILTLGATLLDVLLRSVFKVSDVNVSQQIGELLSFLIPFAVLWRYYGIWFNRQLEWMPAGRALEIRRFGRGLPALAGLITLSIGAGTLLNLLAQTLTAFGSSESLREALSRGLSALGVGLAYWLVNWDPLRVEALGEEEQAQSARRSLVRRVYLYGVLFGSVLAVMGFAISLVYEVLRLLLISEGSDLTRLLSSAFLLIYFSLLLVYHLRQLRHEAAWSEKMQRSRFSNFRVLLLAEDESLVTSLERALEQAAPGVQLVRLSPSSPIPDRGDLLIYPLGPQPLPQWVSTFPTPHVMIPWAAENRFWVGLLMRRWPEQVAKMVRQLALGEELRQPVQSQTVWTVLGYLFAILLAIQVLGMLFIIFASSVVD